MEYRRFGRTGLALSVFSLGTMGALESQATFEATIAQALAAGINHLETAAAYGPSEVWLGQSLGQLLTQSVDRQDLVVTTKIPPTADAAAFERQIDQALERLRLDSIDCLALHGLNTPEHLQWVLDPKGCMAAVERASADGRIGHVGFSSHGALEVIAGAIATDRFDFVNLHYGLFFQRHRPALALAAQRDMGVFIISPGDKGGQLYRPPERLQQLCAPYRPLDLAYRWLLADARISTLSVGPASPAELRWPLSVAQGPLTPAEQQVLDRLQAYAAQALGSDLCSQCYQCLPCPEAIQIPEVLRLRNLAVAYDMESFGQYRYRMFENAGHWFPGRKGSRCTDCGDCLPRCPQQLTIPQLLRDTHQRLNGPERRRLWG